MSDTESNDNEPLSAQDTDPPSVKSKDGRKPRNYYTRAFQDVLNSSASHAAALLQQFIERTRGHKTISRELLDACKFVIDHAVGKAKQKVEHSGGVLTYKQIHDDVGNMEEKGCAILADAEELATKHQQKTSR